MIDVADLATADSLLQNTANRLVYWIQIRAVQWPNAVSLARWAASQSSWWRFEICDRFQLWRVGECDEPVIYNSTDYCAKECTCRFPSPLTTPAKLISIGSVTVMISTSYAGNSEAPVGLWIRHRQNVYVNCVCKKWKSLKQNNKLQWNFALHPYKSLTVCVQFYSISCRSVVLAGCHYKIFRGSLFFWTHCTGLEPTLRSWFLSSEPNCHTAW